MDPVYEAVSPRTLRWTGRIFAVGTAVIIAATIRVISAPRDPALLVRLVRVADRVQDLELKCQCERWEDPKRAAHGSDVWGQPLRGQCVVHGDHAEQFVRSAGVDGVFGTPDDRVTLRHTTWRR